VVIEHGGSGLKQNGGGRGLILIKGRSLEDRIFISEDIKLFSNGVLRIRDKLMAGFSLQIEGPEIRERSRGGGDFDGDF